MTTSLPSNGTLVVQIPFGTTQYAIAFLCTSLRLGTQVNVEQIIEADLRDGSSYNLQLCLPDSSSPPTGSFTGSYDATAIPGTAEVQVSINGFSRTELFNSTTGNWNLTGLAGITDVYVTAFDSLHTILAMKIVRSQTIPGVANGGNPITLAASDAVTLQSIAIANVPGGFNPPLMVPFPSYITANGSAPTNGLSFPLPSQYAVVPATEAQPSDYYFFPLGASATNQFVSTQQFLRTAAPVTLTLPDPWAATPPTPAIFPTFTFNYTGLAGQAAVADTASISWTPGSTFFGINVIATANHQNGATALTIPDLTSLPGFFSMAPSGTSISWVVTTWGGTVQFYQVPASIPQTISNASAQGTYTQP